MTASMLLSLGYEGYVPEQDFDEGPPNITFIDIIAWLSSQLVKLCDLESHVSKVTDTEDSLGFLVEVSSLLKELGCPYKSLVKGQITERLNHPEDKKLLITYLCSELQAAKIYAFKNPKKKAAPMQIELDESKTAKELKEMLICLRFPKPPETITPQQLFGEVEKKLKQLSQPSTPKEKVGELLFTGCLTEKQWFQLEDLYKEMYQGYKTRRHLLLTRLDVTVKSFLWADRLKAKTDDIVNIYNQRKSGITTEPSVKICNVLAAKSDLAIIEKTSSAAVRKHTKSFINSKIIGAVPDRGGRPEEQQPPPPEVPSWQKNDASSRGGFKSSNPPPSSNAGYGRDNTNYNRDTSSYGRDNTNYNRDNSGYGRDNTAFKSSSYRDENSNPRAPAESSYKGDISRGSYNKGGRNDYNTAPAPPIYQPVNYLQNPHLGFGGYMPAGDNFQQYGLGDGIAQMNQMNQYQHQPRGGSHGSGSRGRGGYSDRGSNQSRGGGGRGQRRGRGRY